MREGITLKADKKRDDVNFPHYTIQLLEAENARLTERALAEEKAWKSRLAGAVRVTHLQTKAEMESAIAIIRRAADAAIDYLWRQGTGSERDAEIGDEFHEAVTEYKAWKEQSRQADSHVCGRDSDCDSECVAESYRREESQQEVSVPNSGTPEIPHGERAEDAGFNSQSAKTVPSSASSSEPVTSVTTLCPPSEHRFLWVIRNIYKCQCCDLVGTLLSTPDRGAK